MNPKEGLKILARSPWARGVGAALILFTSADCARPETRPTPTTPPIPTWMGAIPRTPTPAIIERPVEPGWQRYRSLNPYQIDYPAEWKAESKGTQPETIKYFDIFFTTSNYTSVTIFSGKLAQPSAFNLMDYARNIETSYYNSDLYQRAFSELILPKTVAGNEIVMFSLHYVPKSSKPEFSQRESFQHIIMFIHNESLWQISLSYPFSVSINKAELKEINLKFAKMLESFKLLE